MSESSPLVAGDARGDPTLATRVAFLSRPDSYPERPSTVEAIETRLSWVFLTPERAWKLKKPVSYDHLDFSSLKARRQDCEAEIRLNRPLAPGVYLGVEPLTVRPHGLLAVGGDGAPIDYLVCMRRLPSERCLENQIRTGEPDADEVARAAEVLAKFYRNAPVAGAVDPEALIDEVDTNAAELEALPLGQDAGVAALRDGLRKTIGAQRDPLARRVRREVHGDLRPQHVYPGEPPVFLDRLTFRRDLRLMDPAEELAFLALDAERLGSAWVGEVFLDTYRRLEGDTVPAEIVACYRAQRALLWALLSGRHLLRGGPERPWRELTREYLSLGRASLPGNAD
jgi:aminoglycoside phosphotransferase family enzyme